ncbi:hypothetical protein L6164_001331 [Bauhinia variegata]|uniref:Uncharacterized protein n=1 Tax=Bauhinia variegata TaxID=167791 RepID=A0ACB9QBC7_BAUVA|nr:hypothetical protein L6164_001331 [Bauhinia variegata]
MRSPLHFSSSSLSLTSHSSSLSPQASAPFSLSYDSFHTQSASIFPLRQLLLGFPPIPSSFSLRLSSSTLSSMPSSSPSLLRTSVASKAYFGHSWREASRDLEDSH